MTRRFRVLHLITRLELGGAQQNTLHCVRHHDRDRFEVELIAGGGGRLDDEARAIPDATVRLVPWLKHAISPSFDLLAVLRLRNHFRHSGVDLVHTHSSKAGILGRLAANLAGVPCVVHTVHGWSFNPTQPATRRRLYAWLERKVAPMTDRILVVAAGHIDAGLDAGVGSRSQYEVVRSGINRRLYGTPTKPRDELRRELGFGPGDFVVGTIANMKPQKAPLDFVTTAAQAHRSNPSMKFFFAGDGELMPDVRRLVESDGLNDVVRLLGWRDDVPDLLNAMDAFVLTSRFEGLPRSVLQAMAAGRPVVATAVDGTPEIVEDGVTGLLARSGDTAGLATHLDRLARDETLRTRLADRASQRLDAEFDIDTMVTRLDQLYWQLLQSRNG
ncbi:MAG: glycosyltransferase [Acidobacteria bacterium]|nr:glycosyltransferase [Acidobacteriota bacterium]NIM61322.1 glycosyltransferase [Acidobacteriota bacterium]NIO58786.1 glycosyltransferase [Acidobacteriota bacterium]NIQ29829.1 glycosyltransferase [Acidobacteriota bacterium]NIQ84552.1 glycosyltransferase [Acidobacteriota bacterium]